MLESILNFLQNVPEIYVIGIVFAFSLAENLFPPSPSDSIIMFGGTLIAIGNAHFHWLLIAATVGSTLGFLIMFFIGMKFDKKIIETGKLKYFNIDMIMKVEHWFQKWGYWVIVINRFLSGTRAVISFFAGMSLLDTKRTTILSFLGALVWNFILIYLGMIFGENWREILKILERMGYYLFAVLFVVSLGVFLFHRIRKSN